MRNAKITLNKVAIQKAEIKYNQKWNTAGKRKPTG